jgi:hypothetical protein
MKKTEKMVKRDVFKLFVIGAVCLLFAGFAWSGQTRNIALNDPLTINLSPETKEEVAKSAFSEAYKVFMSPRCANCHPGGDVPTQNDAMTLHTQGIIRGTDGKGKYGMKCATCHQLENLEGEHLPPGVSTGWHMPPANMRMIFQGRSAKQLCEQFKDPKQNGGKKTLAEAMEHLEKDPLVLWGWSPGNGRTLPPMSHEEFMKNIHAWVDNGGACPD